MCGISGYILANGSETSTEKIRRMNDAIAHRGPDDEGITLILPEASSAIDLSTRHTAMGVKGCRPAVDETGVTHRIAFGHRRFSIIDITPAGHQPFWSYNRQVCVAFNGEIYNYVELRRELEGLGHAFTTDSDTEVLVEAYLEWGEGCFSRFNGFWALSLYDAKKRAVLLSRDRIGKSPLYVAKTSSGLWWSSEIKGILSVLGSSTFKVRDQAVSDFILNGWRDVFHETFYKGITTFPNAAYAWVQPDGAYQPQKFWELPQQRLSEKDISTDEAVAHFRDLIADAVKIRLRADVPVGFGLSGGMDSSALVALAANRGTRIHAFTVSFPGSSVDEEPFARRVVEHYPGRVGYTVFKPPEDDLFDRADSFIWLMEEPFHSPNMLTNQGILQAMAQEGIRVCINGSAGDEVLAGYASHYYEPYLRSLLSNGRFLRFSKEFFSFSENRSAFSIDNLRKAYHLLPERMRIIHNKAMEIPARIDPFIKPVQVELLDGPSPEINQRLLDNMGDWLMNYWMRSGNTMLMGVPIEVRAPFLDFRVVDFGFTLPVSYLIRDGWLKWVLRQAVKDILPSEVVFRKVKAGFPFPYAEWLPASKVRFFKLIGGLDCPYIDTEKLSSGYMEISRRNPEYLWRVMVVALWWKRCVQGESLVRAA